MGICTICGDIMLTYVRIMYNHVSFIYEAINKSEYAFIEQPAHYSTQ